MNEIVLSICIPTYNRSKSLDDLLASIDSIKTMIGYEIEICVSNNNSTDNTRQILSKWSSIYQIVVNHNETNIGFSGNMKKLLEIANGKWIFYIGDDDILMSENVIKILSILSNVRTDAWVLIPTLNRNNPQSSWLTELRLGKYSWLQMQLKVLCKGVSRFGFIGCHIISRKYKRSNLDIPIGFCESWIHQNYWFLHLILRRNFYFTGIPLVEINTAVNTVKYSREMWVFLWLQRLNNFSNMVSAVKIGNLLLILVLLREFFAISQNREWARFALFYPNSGSYRLKKVELKIKPNSRIDSKIIIVYLKIILVIFIFFKLIRKLSYVSRAT